MSIDDSACNLASLNLMKFRREDGELDVEAFSHAADVMFLAQEVAVGNSSYPTPEIERNAKAFRQLGLGYANLGALLMARGLPYDSDEGRAYAAAITGLMTGRAYRKSAEIAGRMGPFAGYKPNAAAMIGVMAQHRAAVGNIQDSDVIPADLLGACRQALHPRGDLEDREPPEAPAGGRSGKVLLQLVKARREGNRNLPQQLQGRAAAVGQEGRRRADAARGRDPSSASACIPPSPPA